jgi:hypothetical protein
VQPVAPLFVGMAIAEERPVFKFGHLVTLASYSMRLLPDY